MDGMRDNLFFLYISVRRAGIKLIEQADLKSVKFISISTPWTIIYKWKRSVLFHGNALSRQCISCSITMALFVPTLLQKKCSSVENSAA